MVARGARLAGGLHHDAQRLRVPPFAGAGHFPGGVPAATRSREAGRALANRPESRTVRAARVSSLSPRDRPAFSEVFGWCQGGVSLTGDSARIPAGMPDGSGGGVENQGRRHLRETDDLWASTPPGVAEHRLARPDQGTWQAEAQPRRKSARESGGRPHLCDPAGVGSPAPWYRRRLSRLHRVGMNVSSPSCMRSTFAG